MSRCSLFGEAAERRLGRSQKDKEWWLSLGFAILEALIFSCYSLPYSIYAAGHRVNHVMVTSFLLVCGAMTITWICDKILESGFGSCYSSSGSYPLFVKPNHVM
ncbi:hypothetical protein ACSBR1_040212 [Camellia fascicularis]